MESSYSFRQNILTITNIFLHQSFWYLDKKMRDQCLDFDILIHVKQDVGYFVCLFVLRLEQAYRKWRVTNLLTRPMVINDEKLRRFQLMVLVLFINNDFHGTFHGNVILPKSSFPFDQRKRMLRLNVQNIFIIWLLLYRGFPVIEVSS